MLKALEGLPTVKYWFLILALTWGAVGGGMFIAADFIASDGLITHKYAVIGRDFLNAWTGGKAVLTHQLDLLYDRQAYVHMQRTFIGLPTGIHNFSYPPHVLLFLWPLGLMPYVPALIVWTGLTATAFVLAARPYLRELPVPAVAAVILPASMVNIWAGHYGFIIGALLLSGFTWLQHKPVRAGVMFGLMTIKPHLGVLVPLVLALRGEWRAFWAAALTTFALMFASVLVFGLGPWQHWIADTLGYQQSLIEQMDMKMFVYPRMMPTVWVSFRLIANEQIAGICQVLFALVAIGHVAAAARAKVSNAWLAYIVATATFLVLPYAFNYDMTVISLAIAVIFGTHWATLQTWERLALCLAFAAPMIVFQLNLSGIPVLPFALLATLNVQTRLALRERGLPPNPAVRAAAA